MRKLCLAAAGYTTAALLAHYLLPEKLWAIFALAAALLCLPALLLKGEVRRRALIVLLSAAVGFSWCAAHWRIFIAPAQTLTGSTKTVQTVAVDYSADMGNYRRVYVRLNEDGLPRVKVCVYDYSGDMCALAPGDEAEMTLRFTSALVSRGEETDSYLSSGVYSRAYLSGEAAVTGRWRFGFLLFPKVIGQAVKKSIDAVFAPDTAGLMRALLTGDKTEIYTQTEVYSDLKLAGLSHIIAVSGMHVAFLISAVRLFTGRRRRTALIGIPLMLVFMAMTGFTPSVVRAGVMQIILLLAPILRREYDPPTGLAAALLLILLANPQAVGSISLQLSFAAMAGITILTPRIWSWFTNDGQGRAANTPIIKGIVNISSASLGTMAFTVPLTAIHFGYAALYSVLSNILCLWTVSAAFVGGYAACLLGLLWTPLGKILAWCVSWAVRYIMLVARLTAGLPYAALFTEDIYVAWWIVLVYVVFIAAWLLKGDKRLRPVIPLSVCLAGFAAVLILHGTAVKEGEITVTAVDVGQGQSIVVLESSSTVVIDCGSINSAKSAGECTAEYLAKNGRPRIDMLVLTHLHADHANGVTTLMNMVDVDRLVLPGDADDAGYTEPILSAADRHGIEVICMEENTAVQLGELTLRLFAPIGGESANERGIIVLGSSGNFDFLVTGDADSGVEKLLAGRYRLPDIEVLVAGHHGSKFSTCIELLEETKPETALISVGYNTYGHPSDEVLERLRQYGVDALRTDEEGNISVSVGLKDG